MLYSFLVFSAVAVARGRGGGGGAVHIMQHVWVKGVSYYYLRRHSGIFLKWN
jgi:hypothetical protein